MTDTIESLRQQNTELTGQLEGEKAAAQNYRADAIEAQKQRDALLAFADAYIAAWRNGSPGDSDIFFMAESAIANVKGGAA